MTNKHTRLKKLEQSTGMNEELPYFMKEGYKLPNDPIEASRVYLEFIQWTPPGWTPPVCSEKDIPVDPAEASRAYLEFIQWPFG
jgi:hypothetical protein